MKPYRNFTLGAVILALSLTMPHLGQAAPPNMIPIEEPQNQIQINQTPQNLSTPQLLDAAVASGELDQETANLYLAYALGDSTKLPTRYRSDIPWDGTLPILKLQRAVKTMKSSAKRTTIEKLLTGTCGDSDSTLPHTTNTPHFHIEYDTIGGGLDINAYSTSLETTWTTEIISMTWAAPPVLASNPPPSNLYHVRIDTLGSGLYGYVTNGGVHAGFVGNNPNTAWNDADAYATCMVLNRDYSGFPGSAQQALNATTAHEFNHSIQFGYGALTGANSPDISLIEGGATWMEDEVFDSANDNYNYLWPTFEMCMGEYTASPYLYWITLRGLTERYGTGTASGGEQVMQDFWEETSQSASSNMLAALNTALVNKGSTLADAYHAYAITVKFNKTCAGGYVYPHCFEEGADYVAAAGATSVHGSIATVGASYSGSIADNYAMNWISLPTSGIYSVTLQNTSTGGQLRGSVVCDTGTALNVTPLPSVVGVGGTSVITNFDPSSCTSAIAVVTNQAQTADNPASCPARSYKLSTGGATTPITHTFVYLPIVIREEPPCNPIGESDNINDALTVSSGQTVCGQVNASTDLDDVYKVLASDGQQLTISMTGDGGDADLYLYLPSATDVNTDTPVAASENVGNTELIQGTVSGPTNYWYIDVYAYSGTTDYELTVTVSTPDGKEGKMFTVTGTTEKTWRRN